MATPRRRARMSDVAAAAGVSTTTVSLVLSGKAGSSIPDVTQVRVFEASRALGYRANAVARNLRRQSSETIGLISDTIASTPFAGLMVRGADQAAAAAGMTLMIINTERDPEVEARAIDTLLTRRVDAIIYATMFHRIVESPPALKEVHAVFLDCRTDDPDDCWVVPDDETGGYDATIHLIEHGHHRIGYIREANTYPADPERFTGYQRALAEHGIAFDERLVAVDYNDPFGGHAAAARLLALDEPPTAIQCYTDRMAMGAYRAVRHAGLRVPDDVSIIGFDNQDQIAPWLDPPLTTVQLPHEAMGRWAVEHLLGVLSGDIEGPRQQRMHCPLVVRDLVAPPRDRRGSGPAASERGLRPREPRAVADVKHGARRKDMTHTNARRRLALLASAALVGAVFTVTPVVAQGDPNVCDGVIDGAPLTLDMTMHTGSNPGAEMETVEAFNAGPGAELGVTINVIAIGEQAYETAIASAAAAGEMPDLVDMDGPSLYPFAFNGLLRPITSCASEEKLDTFLPVDHRAGHLRRRALLAGQHRVRHGPLGPQVHARRCRGPHPHRHRRCLDGRGVRPGPA